MASLRLPRREKFAQEIARSPKTGKTITQCYEAAGYTTRGHASEVAGSRLMSQVEIRERIDEIVRPATRKARVTVESLLVELERTIGDARADGQHGVVINALGLSAKLVGLLRDRIEVSGPGDVIRTDTIEGLIDQLGGGNPAVALAALEETMADVRAELMARAGDQATVVG